MKGVEDTGKRIRINNSISGWLKKPKMDMRGASKGMSRSQPNKGKVKPR